MAASVGCAIRIAKVKATERFSTRAEAYREHRPRYPREFVEVLRRECGLASDWVIADVAAGTGLLAEIFLENGDPVIAVEPNAPMRAVCEELRGRFPRLRCFEGTAEATGLAENSVDMVIVGQAMHWFDLEKTRAEFARILRPGGWCVVVYNNRRLGGDPFHEAFERFLLEFGFDYTAVKEKHVGRRRLAQFFAPSAMQCETLLNAQPLTLAALKGRVLSASYMPQPGHPRFPAMDAAIEKLFEHHAQNGAVTMVHDCVVCWGVLG